MESVFYIVLVDRLDNSNNLRSLLKKFSYSKLSKIAVLETSPFHGSAQILDSILVILVQWLHYRPFPNKLLTISKRSQEIFFLESAFVVVRNPGQQVGNVREKKTDFQKNFLNF